MRTGGDDITALVSHRGLRFVSVYGIALLATFLATTAVILVLGHNPLEAYRVAFRDSVGTWGGLGQSINRMTPLLLASLTFSIGRHSGLANIGMDGQIYLGAIFATGLGLAMARSGVTGVLVIPVLFLVGAAGGALWSGIAGALRVKWKVNEIFSTVMLNFIALYLVEYLTTGPWNDPVAGEAISLPLPRSFALPMLIPGGGAHAGILLAAVVAAGLWWTLYRTVPGFELRVTGGNVRAAQFSGIRIGSVHVVSMILGGTFSGLAGAIEVTGVHHRLMLGLSPGYGMMAILIAVLGRYHPLALIPVNLVMAILIAGTDSLQRTVGLPSAAVFLIQALIVLVVLGIEAWLSRRDRYVE